MDKKWLIAIIILGLGIRFLGINNILYTDENGWAIDATHFDVLKNPNTLIGRNVPHPPIPIVSYALALKLFGPHTFSFRIVPIIYSILTFLFIYLISKHLYSEKAAFYAVFLSLFSFWPFIASLQVDIDGAILSCFYAGAFYFYLMFEKHKQNRYLIFTGIFLGFALLSKLSGILGFAVLGLYVLAKNRNILKTVKKLLMPFAIGIGIFILFASVLYMIVAPEIFKLLFYHSSQRLTLKPSFVDIVYILLWGTPLLIGLMLLNIRDYSKKDLLFYIWISLITAFYFFISNPFLAPFDRYLMPILPAMVIIGGKYLSKLDFNKKSKVKFLISFGAYLAILELLNSFRAYKAHNIAHYISDVLSFYWNFYFPITGPSGPTFGVGFMAIGITFLLSFILLTLYFILNKIQKKPFHNLLIVFIGLNITFNLFLIEESALYLHGPNISKKSLEAINYVKNNYNSRTIYTNFVSVPYYLGRHKNLLSAFSLNDNEDNVHLFNYNYGEKFAMNMDAKFKEQGPIVVLFNFPIWSNENTIFQKINKCNAVREFEDKSLTIATVFDCSNLADRK